MAASSSSSSSSRSLAIVAGAGVALSSVAALLYRRRKNVDETARSALLISDAELKKRFTDRFPSLVDEFITECKVKHSLGSKPLARFRRMLDYSCLGGKMYRGMTVVSTVRELAKAKMDSRDGLYADPIDQAIVLGWAIEVMQACFLVADDIMDSSVTRRGKPCWYKQPDIGYDAVNDVLVLETFMYFLLERHFGPKSPDSLRAAKKGGAGKGAKRTVAGDYQRLVDLFRSVSFCTQLGQTLDCMAQPQGQKGVEVLAGFSAELHTQIVVKKTAYYTFYLPFACGMVVGGCASDKQLSAAEALSVEIGHYFQVQDDYLDAFGDEAVLGKKGTDIVDHKCSWLCVQALLLMSKTQRARFEQIYGKDSEELVDEVKQLYRDLGLVELYHKFEEDAYKKIQGLIKDVSGILPPAIFEQAVAKIYKRDK